MVNWSKAEGKTCLNISAGEPEREDARPWRRSSRSAGSSAAEAGSWGNGFQTCWDGTITTGRLSEYVHKALSGHGWHQYQLTYRNSFRQLAGANWRNTEVLLKQREIIREIAEEGSDCIIVGRDADVILHEEHPFRIYVCADIRNRLERCMRFEEKKEPEERLTEKEILRNIRRIDRNRRQIREILTGKSATDGSAFDLTVNATGWDIKKLAEAVAEFSGRWFAK